MRHRDRLRLIPILLLCAFVLACGGQPEEREESAGPAPQAPAGTPAAAPASDTVTSGTAQVDPALPAYQKTGGISGNLSSVGSDTLNNLMTLWTEEFKRNYPNVRIQVEGKGSSTAPPALIQGTAQLGPMSREMKASEIDEFEKKYGYKPTPIRVAIDALAVFVHRDNPLEQLTLPEVDAIFSKNRSCGHPKEISTWGDAGVSGALAGQRMSLYGRNSASGTYGFFKEHALCKGDFKDTVKEQPGSASVVQGVSQDRTGIGYSGIGYRTSGIKTLALAKAAGQRYQGTDPETVLSGEYPLSRFLYVYVNQPPGQPLSPLVREFLRYVLNREGQQVVVKDGYLPLPAKTAQEEQAKIR
ncbi:MAG TPA: phosphate ABC transporter substrate-binding protein [Thermoanaerobaculia bacterium]|nr:phosphate ABC transporter substrate-binding protein [Thermoanaerobaculia bacterium]